MRVSSSTKSSYARVVTTTTGAFLIGGIGYAIMFSIQHPHGASGVQYQASVFEALEQEIVSTAEYSPE